MMYWRVCVGRVRHLMGYAVLTPRSCLSAIAVTKCNLIHVQIKPGMHALFSITFLIGWLN
jgi:hypothetical protein